MARKFEKYGQVENIAVHLQNTPTYYVKYRKEEDRIKALIELKHKEGVARVVAREDWNINVSKGVMMEHYFKVEGKQEITKKKENTEMAALYRKKNYI